MILILCYFDMAPFSSLKILKIDYLNVLTIMSNVWVPKG